MVVSALVILYFCVFIFDFIPVFKSKNKALICVYGVLFLSSFIVLFLKQIRVDVPSIVDPMEYFIGSVLKLK